MSGAVWGALTAGAYLAGSVPFAYLIGRARGIDIREHGSGNVGATNVRRVLGKRAGYACLALDMAKGLVPTLGAGLITGAAAGHPLPAWEALAWLGVAAAAILGHVFPVWLGFKGGKGVATGFGALVGIFPVLTAAAAGALVVWLVSMRLTRYVWASSCLAALALPALTLAAGVLLPVADGDGGRGVAMLWPYLTVTILLAALVILRHRSNMARALAGTEPKAGGARSAQGPPSEVAGPPSASHRDR